MNGSQWEQDAVVWTRRYLKSGPRRQKSCRDICWQQIHVQIVLHPRVIDNTIFHVKSCKGIWDGSCFDMCDTLKSFIQKYISLRICNIFKDGYIVSRAPNACDDVVTRGEEYGVMCFCVSDGYIVSPSFKSLWWRCDARFCLLLIPFFVQWVYPENQL